MDTPGCGKILLKIEVFERNQFFPTLDQWINSPRLHRSGSILSRVMVCCLMAPSHHLIKWWIIIKCVLWHSLENNLIKMHERYSAKGISLMWILPSRSCFNGSNAMTLKKYPKPVGSVSNKRIFTFKTVLMWLFPCHCINHERYQWNWLITKRHEKQQSSNCVYFYRVYP